MGDPVGASLLAIYARASCNATSSSSHCIKNICVQPANVTFTQGHISIRCPKATCTKIENARNERLFYRHYTNTNIFSRFPSSLVFWFWHFSFSGPSSFIFFCSHSSPLQFRTFHSNPLHCQLRICLNSLLHSTQPLVQLFKTLSVSQSAALDFQLSYGIIPLSPFFFNSLILQLTFPFHCRIVNLLL